MAKKINIPTPLITAVPYVGGPKHGGVFVFQGSVYETPKFSPDSDEYEFSVIKVETTRGFRQLHFYGHHTVRRDPQIARRIIDALFIHNSE